MRLYEFIDDNIITAVPPFDSSEWYLSIAPLLQEHIFMNYGDRETLENARIRSAWRRYAERQATLSEVKNIILQEIQRAARHILISKNRSYSIEYKAIMEDFNPLWNVDGVETLTYTRTNTGTVTNVADQDDKNTGTVTNADTTGSTTTSQATTYDSATWKDTGKDIVQNSGANTRTDNTKYERDQTDTRTDNLTEGYTETKERHGNIGVTKSTELIADTLKVFTDIDFLDMVAHDVANVICARTYGGAFDYEGFSGFSC